MLNIYQPIQVQTSKNIRIELYEFTGMLGIFHRLSGFNLLFQEILGFSRATARRANFFFRVEYQATWIFLFAEERTMKGRRDGSTGQRGTIYYGSPLIRHQELARIQGTMYPIQPYSVRSIRVNISYAFSRGNAEFSSCKQQHCSTRVQRNTDRQFAEIALSRDRQLLRRRCSFLQSTRKIQGTRIAVIQSILEDCFLFLASPDLYTTRDFIVRKRVNDRCVNLELYTCLVIDCYQIALCVSTRNAVGRNPIQNLSLFNRLSDKHRPALDAR